MQQTSQDGDDERRARMSLVAMQQAQQSNQAEAEDGKSDWRWAPVQPHFVGSVAVTDPRTVHFHTTYAFGSACAAGSLDLHEGVRAYWRLAVRHISHGTSVMFGVGRAPSPSSSEFLSFGHQLGQDDASVALSHDGEFWSNGEVRQLTAPFKKHYDAVTILWDGPAGGKLSFFVDGRFVGSPMNVLMENTNVSRARPFRPLVSSTAQHSLVQVVELRVVYVVPSLMRLAQIAAMRCSNGWLRNNPKTETKNHSPKSRKRRKPVSEGDEEAVLQNMNVLVERNDAVAAEPANAKEENTSQNFVVLRPLGEGSFGEVLLIADRKNPESAIAMKLMDTREHANMVQAFRREALIQRLVTTQNGGSKHVVHFCGMREIPEQHQFRLFIEYVDGGELFDQIEPDVGMPLTRAHSYWSQLLSGVAFLHQCGVTHRDLKPENLLLTKQDVLKIADFGMATLFRDKGKERMLEAKCGTRPYAAPEVYVTKYRAEPADIWSCGVILVAMLAGELPWEEPTMSCPNYLIWRNSTALDTRPWSKMSTLALSLLRTVLCEAPDQRATIERIRQHPWMRSPDAVNGTPSRKRRAGESSAISQPVWRRRASGLSNVVNSMDAMVVVDPGRPETPPTSTEQENRASASDEQENQAPVASSLRDPPPLQPKQQQQQQQQRSGGVRKSSRLAARRVGPNQTPTMVTSFTQPADVKKYELLSSQIDQLMPSQAVGDLDPLERMARRMTRFCVVTPMMQLLDRIEQVCTDLGYGVKRRENGLLVTSLLARSRMTFDVAVYKLKHADVTKYNFAATTINSNGGQIKLLVDFRRSTGDGIEFKRAFTTVRNKLSDLICRDGSSWLEERGLCAGPSDNGTTTAAGSSKTVVSPSALSSTLLKEHSSMELMEEDGGSSSDDEDGLPSRAYRETGQPHR